VNASEIGQLLPFPRTPVTLTAVYTEATFSEVPGKRSRGIWSFQCSCGQWFAHNAIRRHLIQDHFQFGPGGVSATQMVLDAMQTAKDRYES
jgi:hypothetical protein